MHMISIPDGANILINRKQEGEGLIMVCYRNHVSTRGTSGQLPEYGVQTRVSSCTSNEHLSACQVWLLAKY